MNNSISFINIYLAPFLILLSVIRFFSLSFRKDLIFSFFIIFLGVLGVWEVAQVVVLPPYFNSLEAIFLGILAGTFLSMGLKSNTVSQSPKKERVLAKLPIFGALVFLSLDNFYPDQTYRIFFIISILGTLGLYAKKNKSNRYFQGMVSLFFLGLLAQHFKMDDMFKSSFLLLGFFLLAFRLSALEIKND